MHPTRAAQMRTDVTATARPERGIATARAALLRHQLGGWWAGRSIIRTARLRAPLALPRFVPVIRGTAASSIGTGMEWAVSEAPSTMEQVQIERLGKRRPSTWLWKLGAGVSVAWVAVLAVAVLRADVVPWGLPMNEFGDFLAGAFAPLAFFWLVLGFLQQGEELRHSSEALWLQGRELQNSVEQQRALVEASREQLAFERQMLQQQSDELARSSRPIWQLRPAGSIPSEGGVRTFRFTLSNVGRACSDIIVKKDGHIVGGRPALETGNHIPIEFVLENDALRPSAAASPFTVSVEFLDARALPGVSRFDVTVEGGDFKVIEASG